jgi:hypothetical protein
LNQKEDPTVAHNQSTDPIAHQASVIESQTLTQSAEKAVDPLLISIPMSVQLPLTGDSNSEFETPPGSPSSGPTTTPEVQKTQELESESEINGAGFNLSKNILNLVNDDSELQPEMPVSTVVDDNSSTLLGKGFKYGAIVAAVASIVLTPIWMSLAARNLAKYGLNATFQALSGFV